VQTLKFARSSMRRRRRDRTDTASSLPPATSSDRGVSTLALRDDGASARRARSHYALTAWPAPRPHVCSSPDGQRSPSDRRQHGTLDCGRRRVGQGEAWRTRDARLEEAASGRELITAVDGGLTSVTGDAAYDSIAFCEMAAARGAIVVVPPNKSARVATETAVERSGSNDQEDKEDRPPAWKK